MVSARCIDCKGNGSLASGTPAVDAASAYAAWGAAVLRFGLELTTLSIRAPDAFCQSRSLASTPASDGFPYLVEDVESLGLREPSTTFFRCGRGNARRWNRTDDCHCWNQRHRRRARRRLQRRARMGSTTSSLSAPTLACQPPMRSTRLNGISGNSQPLTVCTDTTGSYSLSRRTHAASAT